MASLSILAGENVGTEVQLDQPIVVIGRDARRCQIPLKNMAVSKEHARIRFIDGRHVVEDLQSRNKTYLNDHEIHEQHVLKSGDRIRICDSIFEYFGDSPQKTVVTRSEGFEFSQFDSSETSTIRARRQRLPSSQLLELQPVERLKGILEISEALGKVVRVDQLLETVAEVLLATFRQADRCFVVLRGDTPEKLIPKVIRLRRPGDGDSARFSSTIVREALATGQGLLSENAPRDSKFAASQSVTDFRILSVMCAPIGGPNEANGVILLDSQDRMRAFTEEDLSMLMATANQVSIAMEKMRLQDELLVQERFQRDLELAQQVQRSFLPQHRPEVRGYEFFSMYQSALTIGGDYFDFIALPDGRWAILLGDVAGKGVSAALLMAKLSAEARFSILKNGDPGIAISMLNDSLIRFGFMDRFVTLCAAILEPDTNLVSIVNAGHMPPLVARGASRAIEETFPGESRGLPLGIESGQNYKAFQIKLEPTDSLIFYTDGVTDSLSPSGQAFGSEGLRRAVQDSYQGARNAGPDDIGNAIAEAVQQHAKNRDQNDDIAIVCLGRLGNRSSISTLDASLFTPMR